jgi:hypothetical protein
MTNGATKMADVADQIQKFWGPLGLSQLYQENPLLNIVNRDYEGNLQAKGDTVYVSVIKPLTGFMQTIGTDADTFETEKVETVRTAIQATKVFSSNIEMESLAELQSQLDSGNPKLRESMIRAINNKINAYLYSFVKSSIVDGSTGDSGVTTISKTEFRGARVYAGASKWPKDGNWFALLDPAFWGDITIDSTLASVEFTGETPITNSMQFRKLLDFNVTEDNSLPNDQALFFHRDFLYAVMQTGMVWNVTDLRSNYKRGVLLTCEMVGGAAKNAYIGDTLHYPVYGSSWVAPT